MLSSLELTAFKAFDELSLPLGGLTLLAGVNSAGKSSVLQALSLVRQSFDAAMLNQSTRGELLLNGALVELGTVADIYCEYARREPSLIGFGFHGDEDEESLLLKGTGVAEEPAADVVRLDVGTHVPINTATAFLRNSFNYLRADRL
ncbi:MAG: AAA family ATPase, partial [Rhodospirillaceae bacterium]|nr:AAA family ATPase [Rhodospirillaceae bacterium]